jgi:hypothetical protein
MTDLSNARRQHLQTPPRAQRMLSRPGSQGSASPRTSIRVDVPDRLLRMTRFGLDFATEGSGWWRRVEREMQALVDSHLPSRAADVQMELDVDRFEVVLSYRLPAAAAQPGRCA